MIIGISAARGMAAALTVPLAVGVTASACLAVQPPELVGKTSGLSPHRTHFFDVADLRHAGHGAVFVAQSNRLPSDFEKRERAREVRRQAQLCADWSKGFLERFFRRATAADTARCLKMGASVTNTDRKGRTPLYVAARTTGDPDVISLLVEAGADVMKGPDDGSRNTPLHAAAYYNPNVDVVARLIDLGADVNAKNADRWQPLHWAAYGNRNPDVAGLLIERGADLTTTVDRRLFGEVQKTSLWELARGNGRARGSDWYRALEAEAMKRKAAEEAKRLAEIERQREESERRIEEARRKQRERLAALEKQRRERERLAEEARRLERERLAELARERERRAEDARNRQRKRLAKKAAAIAKERGSCEPALEEVGLVGAWRKRGPVIAALKDDGASPLDAYADAIPFLLAGAGKHAEVEEAFAARVLRDVDRWVEAGIRRESETLTTWIGVSRLLRQNCLHEIADFIVVSVASGAARDFHAIVFWETSGGLPLVQPEAMRALDHVPQGILAEVSETGRVNEAPRMFASAIEAAAKAIAKRFVWDCVDYFNAQSELRKGRSLTKVQRDAVTELCACFHERAGAKGHLSDEPKFTEIMAELLDSRNAFSLAHADIKTILGQCSVLHGQSLK